MDPHFIILDGSYFMFFRFHAMKRWWSFSRREGEEEDGLSAPRYKESFTRLFKKKLKDLDKAAIGPDWKSRSVVRMVARDGPSEHSWRRAVYPEYKAGRGNDEGVKRHFQLEEEERLFAEGGYEAALSYAGLEADDCIAITVDHIRRSYPSARVTIVSSDGDFTQLLGPMVDRLDLKGKRIGGPGSEIDAREALFCKIVGGDPSDNIPPVLARCGPKTAAALYREEARFLERLKKEPGAAGVYARNRLLVDFRFVPEPLAAGFRRECLRAV